MCWIVYPFIGLIVLFACFILYKARQETNRDILKTGTFIVLTLTLIFLAIYTFDTNRSARLAQKRWERESILLATYEMGVTDPKGKTSFLILNPSNLMLEAKVWCNLKVYGAPVHPPDAYNGKKVWTILPQHRVKGVLEIESFLKQSGNTVHKMIKEYSDENRDNQLTLDLTIEFRNELGDKRILPSMRYYFVFNEWKWIPMLTLREDWSLQ